MKKLTFNYVTVYGCLLVLAMLAMTTQTMAQNEDSGNVKTEIAKVTNFAGTAVIPQAGASLSRNNSAVFGTISTSGLTPGNVVTLWWAIFNNSDFCAAPVCAASDLNKARVKGSLQYGGGAIVGAGGRADFAGYLAVDDNAGFTFPAVFPNLPNPAPGILDAKRAQIHLVIRDHGPASSDPGLLQQQLSTFGTGANIQAAVFQP